MARVKVGRRRGERPSESRLLPAAHDGRAQIGGGQSVIFVRLQLFRGGGALRLLGRCKRLGGRLLERHAGLAGLGIGNGGGERQTWVSNLCGY